MLEIDDKLFGKLEYDDSWIGSIKVPLFLEIKPVEFVIECYEDEEISESQRAAFRLFSSKLSDLMLAAESAIFHHYIGICEEYRNKFDEKYKDEWAPIIKKPYDLASKVKLKSVFFPQAGDSKVYGLLFTCSWEPELGLGVKFIEKDIAQVGHQDIIL